MRLIWLIIVFFIAYGSLYPFNFDLSRAIPPNLLDWLLNWEQRTIRSDVIANILLFIPYGFFGALTIGQDKRRYLLFSLLVMLAVGIVFALILQLLQFYLPSRVPHAADATINAIGMLIGVMLAAYTSSERVKRLIPQGFRFRLAPALLVFALWIGWQFFPYIPVFESKQFGAGLDILVKSSWSLITWLENLTFWLAFYIVLGRVSGKAYSLNFLIGISIFILIIKLAMYRSHLGWSEISAVPLALLLQAKLEQNLKLWWLFLSALGLMIYSELAPFSFSGQINSVQWMPFENYLKGSTWNNLHSLLQESLLIAVMGYFLGRVLKSYRKGGVLLMFIMSIISVVQLFVAGQNPDITLWIISLGIAVLLERFSE